MDVQQRVRGCLLGGAIGDALGAPIEFQSLREIRRNYGKNGIDAYVTDWRGKAGLITDDTQMTLFTVEGLVRGGERPVAAMREAYLRWLDTQNHSAPPPQDRPHRTGWLREERWLYSRRAPGNACLSGLRHSFPGPAPLGVPGPVNGNSKGCGTVMRSAPFGLVSPGDPRAAFELAAACAQITHGHVTGYLAAGAFAAIVARLTAGAELRAAVQDGLDLLSAYPGHEETSAAVRAAVTLAGGADHTPEAVESLGGAWVAEEALAIGVYCALAEPSIERALLLSVNHSGDSDSTGSVCGNLLGARHGADALPARWLRDLEGRETIERLADALV
ncbi:ADP-ribosylglycohydrolase family protein [Nonomuraea sp. NN258]|uniref:ADP-ribosylglycohydrolase family protein n=1 Tax=Nonomuraea antri TaxID=2730852 RepID=UPI001569F970|nr:ADP-ribosylglycohydrolase family protein [Nonomuraea antri]NRQ35354.1 ADP-ribosylglycohydrolase family protein [Nonomuraea antri]